jgi:hypothetical protein
MNSNLLETLFIAFLISCPVEGYAGDQYEKHQKIGTVNKTVEQTYYEKKTSTYTFEKHSKTGTVDKKAKQTYYEKKTTTYRYQQLKKNGTRKITETYYEKKTTTYTYEQLKKTGKKFNWVKIKGRCDAKSPKCRRVRTAAKWVENDWCKGKPSRSNCRIRKRKKQIPKLGWVPINGVCDVKSRKCRRLQTGVVWVENTGCKGKTSQPKCRAKKRMVTVKEDVWSWVPSDGACNTRLPTCRKVSGAANWVENDWCKGKPSRPNCRSKKRLVTIKEDVWGWVPISGVCDTKLPTCRKK